jgi:uncharacterized protein (DUF111 family)
MLLMVNIDNVPGDQLNYLIDRILKIGAKNVNVVQSLTKKSRFGYLFFIDTKDEFVDPIAEFLARETGTLGVRLLESTHRKHAYTFHQVRIFIPSGGGFEKEVEAFIRVKLVINGDDEVVSARAEYSDLEAACQQAQSYGIDASLAEIKALAELTAIRESKPTIGRFFAESVDGKLY